MRARTLAFLSLLLSAVACSSFGSDGGAEPSSPTDDDDDDDDDDDRPPTPDGGRADAPTEVFEAGPSSPVPAGAFDDLVGGVIDHFEGANRPGGGPFGWQVMTDGEPDRALSRIEPCGGMVGCAGPTLLVENEGGAVNYLRANVQASTRVLRFDFSLRVDSAQPAIGLVQLASLQLEDDHFIVLDLEGTTLRISDQIPTGEPFQYDTSITKQGTVAEYGIWAAYRFYVNLDAGVAALSKNGLPFSAVRELRPAIRNTRIEAVRTGITYVQNAQFTLRYDAVAMKEWAAAP